MYYRRIIEKLLIDQLNCTGAVLIEGPKWCGKTTTGNYISKSNIHLDDSKNSFQTLEMAKLNPESILAGETPRLIDEWQLVPLIWTAVRSEVDKRQTFGQFILTGSSVPINEDLLLHSGTGRISSLEMYPMSLAESLDSTSQISLSKLFENPLQNISAKNTLSLENIASLICRGGRPATLNIKDNYIYLPAKNYINEIIERDINRVDKKNRKKDIAKKILRSYARNLSTEVTDIAIANDCDIDVDTLRDYLWAFKKMLLIKELDSWNPNLRSKTAIRAKSIRHFVDPSLAAASLGITPSDLINDLHTFGLFFESMVIRDLRIYSSCIYGDLYHYRDNTGLECDSVIHLDNGKYALIEVKLGSKDAIELGAQNLLKLKKKINTSEMGQPSFLMIITATNYAYKREDGIIVCPLACLKE